MGRRQIETDEAEAAALPSKSDTDDTVPPEVDEDDYDDLTGLFPNVTPDDDS